MITDMRFKRWVNEVKLKDVARLVGVTASYLSKIERGLVKPSASLRTRIDKVNKRSRI